MSGKLPLSYDVAQMKIELQRQTSIDTNSCIMSAQQSIGRGLRGGVKKGELAIIAAAGGGKPVFTVDHEVGDTNMQKTDENKDIKNVEFDYIGELIVDTRNYDIDEENMGIVVMSSSVISLTGGITTHLRYTEILNGEDVAVLLGIDKLDECEVDIGICRYVFGFEADLGQVLLNDTRLKGIPPRGQLISKHKYPYAEEEFLDNEYATD